MLSLLQRDAVSQSEGDTLGHAPTQLRLRQATDRGSARVIILRDPIDRILSRYW